MTHYTGNIHLTPENVLSISNAADIYGIESLTQLCEGFLLLNLNDENVWMILHCCVEDHVVSKMTTLKIAAIGIIVLNFGIMSKLPEFQELPPELQIEICGVHRDYLSSENGEYKDPRCT